MGRTENTVGRAPTLHMTKLDFFSCILNGSLSTARVSLSAKPRTNPEHCWEALSPPQKKKHDKTKQKNRKKNNNLRFCICFNKFSNILELSRPGYIEISLVSSNSFSSVVL